MSEARVIGSMVKAFQAETSAMRDRLSETGERRQEQRERLAEFTRLVERHDLTWDASDALQIRQGGRAERQAINTLARTLPQAEVNRVWEAKLERSLVAEGRPLYPAPQGLEEWARRQERAAREERSGRDER